MVPFGLYCYLFYSLQGFQFFIVINNLFSTILAHLLISLLLLGNILTIFILILDRNLILLIFIIGLKEHIRHIILRSLIRRKSLIKVIFHQGIRFVKIRHVFKINVLMGLYNDFKLIRFFYFFYLKTI